MRNIYSNIIKFFFIGLVFYSCCNIFFTDFLKENQESTYDKKEFNIEKGPRSGTSSSTIGWKANWRDYDFNYYNGTVKVREDDLYKSILNKYGIFANTWGDFYRGLYLFDRYKLDLTYPMLDRIWNNNNFTRRGFLNVIMSFVQGMEYNILYHEDCRSAYNNDQSVREMMYEGTECDGDVYGEIYTPLEFIANFKGDCDSRTVFLYTILKRYNYDVVILNSDVYGHSILGVNIPSSGRYKFYNGKRYYVWETTAFGWRLGDLPPQFNNMNYWDVFL